ncbi:MAG TPA: hypothetical protein VGV17_02965 [Bosea sp. (in: a-proteobacteria)]|jgi:hypothetical protein|uniref:hypothetical protein n=1 Tax=Bosea sp. (in: a-proteobacteria) TaxID=1871050 RepID=UPI002DDD50F2|nr:hypothetical protein [Bosea sp. (in: a-proteobacteria)]HEV2552706.1 hypothetical protein [Bosea sp. (in: a-proteobacteria)]
MPGNSFYAEDLFFQGGLITVENGSATVTGAPNVLDGSATVWTSAAQAGDSIAIGATRHYILEIVSDTELTLTEPWSGADATDSGYTGARAPWHLSDRSLGYKFSRFLESDATSSATATAAAAEAVAARGDAIAARDLAQAWASRPANTDVTTTGTRSALHYSLLASTSATAADTARAAAVTAQNAAAASATRAADWAEKADNTDVTTAGTRSAKHHAGAAAGSATAAASSATAASGSKDAALISQGLAQEWAEKAPGAAITGTTTGRSAKHYAQAAADSAAAAAALVFGATNLIDYGLITDLPEDFADYGTVP